MATHTTTGPHPGVRELSQIQTQDTLASLAHTLLLTLTRVTFVLLKSSDILFSLLVYDVYVCVCVCVCVVCLVYVVCVWLVCMFVSLPCDTKTRQGEPENQPVVNAPLKIAPLRADNDPELLQMHDDKCQLRRARDNSK